MPTMTARQRRLDTYDQLGPPCRRVLRREEYPDDAAFEGAIAASLQDTDLNANCGLIELEVHDADGEMRMLGYDHETEAGPQVYVWSEEYPSMHAWIDPADHSTTADPNLAIARAALSEPL